MRSAVAGLLVPLVEPIIEPKRIWALGAIPEPEPTRYSYTWTWDVATQELPVPPAFTLGPPPDNDLIQVAPTIDYDDLAYVFFRIFGTPRITTEPAAKDWDWHVS